MKKILISILLLLSLSACNLGQQTTEQSKKDFIIETKLSKNFSNTITITKPWKISSSQEITITSQVMWQISNIYISEWKEVKNGEIVIHIADTIANYSSQLQKAKTLLDNSILMRTQTQEQLNQAAESTKLALDQATHNFDIAKQQTAQSLKAAQINIDNTTLDPDSSTKLSIDKLISDIQNQATTLQTNLSIQKDSTIILTEDVLHKIDSLLGTTDTYEDLNNSFDSYLGVKNTQQRRDTEKLLKNLYTEKDLLYKIPSQPKNQDIITYTNQIENIHSHINTLLLEMIKTLQNSVTSAKFTQTTINWHLTMIDGIQQQVQATKAALQAYKIQALNFFGKIQNTISGATNLNTLAEQQLQIALKNAQIWAINADINYNNTKLSIENTLFNTQTALKNAQNTFNTTKKTHQTQLDLLDNSIIQSKIAYQDAQTHFDRLTVKSPIQWTINNIMIDYGQEIGVGTPLFSIVGYSNQIIEIYANTNEVAYIQEGQKIGVLYNTEYLPAKITSINPIAGQNTLYKINVSLEQNTKLLWDVAQVHIPITLGTQILPINVITSTANNKGYIFILQDKEIVQFPIKLGKVRWNYIEVLTNIPPTAQIITNNIENYDPTKFQIKILNKESSTK